MITEWLGLAIYCIGGSPSWRLLFGLECVPGISIFIGSFRVPRSSRFLALQGRYDEVLKLEEFIVAYMEVGTIQTCETANSFRLGAQIKRNKAKELWSKPIFTKKSYMRRVALFAMLVLPQE